MEYDEEHREMNLKTKQEDFRQQLLKYLCPTLETSPCRRMVYLTEMTSTT
jgi:hypothetical protein